MFPFRIAPEGLPYVVSSALLTVAVYFIGKPWMVIFPFILFVYMEIFFRDPERTIPRYSDIFVSPADGKVIQIKDRYENEYVRNEMKQISIFMSLLNVHVNRAPCDGTVKLVKHTPGRFRAAYSDDAPLKNEHIVMVLDTEYGTILVRQVAGFLARRAVCRVKPGKGLKRGERFGIIKFGSRVDLFLPKGAQVRAEVGQKVRAGETILGVFIREEQTDNSEKSAS